MVLADPDVELPVHRVTGLLEHNGNSTYGVDADSAYNRLDKQIAFEGVCATCRGGITVRFQ